MAFITNEKREGLIKRINESYTVKKLLMSLEIVLLIAFIVLTFISIYETDRGVEGWNWFEGDKLTGLGIGMLIYAIVIALLGGTSLVLIFTIRSPKSIKDDVKKLESSALSGKKIKKDETAGDVMRSRRNPENAIPVEQPVNKKKKGK
ncbi:MAG: hypothetical protein ACOQNY_00960 [Mycoplasmoidaceae bacterium]